MRDLSDKRGGTHIPKETLLERRLPPVPASDPAWLQRGMLQNPD